MKKLWIILSIFFLGSYLGCHPPLTNTIYLNPDKIGRVKNIAVLPFYNLTESLNAETIMANVIMAELMNSKRFNLVKYGDVMELLLSRKMTSLSTVDIETLHFLRKKLKADAVIIGTIYRYEEAQQQRAKFSPSAVSISVSLIDTKSGQTLWRQDSSGAGSTYGYLLDNMEIYPCFGMAKKVANELLLTITKPDIYARLSPF